MRIHSLQHVPFEGLAGFTTSRVLESAQWTATKFWQGGLLPPPSDIDGLIILGGPMSIHDEAAYPWLREEKVWLSQILNGIKAGEKMPWVIGVCLGAQLLASCLGAQVYPNAQAEIGFYPIQSCLPTNHALSTCMRKEYEVFHWHGETFDLPQGSEHLASSLACKNQGFLWEEKVLALQFHLETNSFAISQLLEHAGADLEPRGQWKATRETLELEIAKQREPVQEMDSFLAYLNSRS